MRRSNLAKAIILAMAATFLLLAPQAHPVLQFLGYLWGILLIVALVLNWNSAAKD